MMDAIRTKQMEKHINILAWIHIVMSALLICLAIFVFAMMFLGGLFSESVDDFFALSIMAVLTSGFMLLFALPGFAAGYGLLKRKTWSRGLTILLGLLNMFNFPIGTAVGVYTFFVLFQKDAGDYFYQVKLA